MMTAGGSQSDVHDFLHMLQVHSDISGNYIIYLKEQIKSYEKKGDDKNVAK
jgi:hypothetical protein